MDTKYHLLSGKGRDREEICSKRPVRPANPFKTKWWVMTYGPIILIRRGDSYPAVIKRGSW